MGLNFVYVELIGWLWFAIGGSHVSDRLLGPQVSTHHLRRDVTARGRGSYEGK